MSNFTPQFLTAFGHCMLYEVGPWWNPQDEDVIAGNIGTPSLNRKVGYVDVDGDGGGCTKYGIAQAYHPNVNVKALNLAQATQIYFDEYWVKSGCDKIAIAITVFYFDACVNNGIPRAGKFLQQAVGAKIDGNVGPVTIAMVNKASAAPLIAALSQIRAERYNLIVQNNPTQAEFLAGWLRRNTEVTQFSLAALA